MYKIEYSRKALKQRQILDSKNKSTQKKVVQVLKRMENNPFFCGNNFEMLPVSHPGCFSRRINWTDRLVYRVDMERKVVLIVGLLGHY